MSGATLTEAAFDPFETRLRGELLRPEGEGYEGARRWNATIDERPALIARSASQADVIAAVHFVHEHGLRASVRGGGHSVAGLSTVDEGLMIDLSPMRAVAVDPEARLVRVEGGASMPPSIRCSPRVRGTPGSRTTSAASAMPSSTLSSRARRINRRRGPTSSSTNWADR